ncbi:MAG TPA: chemotaxis protein CheB [Gammaproteobacteria bacterium]|nr:chemotaxis protein CheB [Gammaproteobacteria bacterium]
MSDQAAVRIAIVADTSLQRHILQQFLVKKGYNVVLNSDPQHLDRVSLKACETDLWLYDSVCSNDTECESLEYFLTEPSAPVLFGEGAAPDRGAQDYLRWERSLLKKILQLTEHLVPVNALTSAEQQQVDSSRRYSIELPQRFIKNPTATDQPAQHVWLLAASMGGPQAVKAFLDVLPQGLPLGFIYAQHIDAHFESRLPQAVGRHSQWPVRLLDDYPFVRNGEVVIVPIKHELNFAENGRLQDLGSSWPGLYNPSIEQMMRNLAQHYGQTCGVIVFSGMGDDGSLAAQYVQQQGAQVWTQTADSCACSSMPDSVREAGYSQLSASPENLAYELVQHFLNTTPKNNHDLERKVQ